MGKSKSSSKSSDKVSIVMNEFKHHQLHRGSKNGPLVTDPKMAYAIAKSEEKRYKKGKH